MTTAIFWKEAKDNGCCLTGNCDLSERRFFFLQFYKKNVFIFTFQLYYRANYITFAATKSSEVKPAEFINRPNRSRCGKRKAVIFIKATNLSHPFEEGFFITALRCTFSPY